MGRFGRYPFDFSLKAGLADSFERCFAEFEAIHLLFASESSSFSDPIPTLSAGGLKASATPTSRMACTVSLAYSKLRRRQANP